MLRGFAGERVIGCVVGVIGKSWYAAQPGPLMCLRLKPLIVSSP
jgi:hypothetical protein